MRITLLLLLVCQQLLAQTPSGEAIPAKEHKWQLGVYASPNVSFRTLINSSGGETGDFIVDSRNSYENPRPGYVVGMSAGIRLRPSLALETGVFLADKGYSARLENLTYGDLTDPRQGFVYGTSPKPLQSVELIDHHYYLGIPLLLRYTAGSGKLRFMCSGGISADVFIGAATTFIREYTDGSSTRSREKRTDSYNRFDLTPTLSTGVDWKLTDRSSLQFAPVVRYGLLHISDTPVTARFYSAGLNVGYFMWI
jgi:hypothetical protein